MNFTYKPKNPSKYAVNLRALKNSTTMDWDIPSGQTTLIIQCPFGERPNEYMEKICLALNDYLGDITSDCFFEIMPDVKARFITAAEKGRQHGCLIEARSRTYMVFAADISGDDCVIYESQMQAMTPPYVDISTEVTVTVEQQTKSKGFISKSIVPTGYYIIRFDKSTFINYTDGDLVYKIGSLSIPITSQMISLGAIYIKTTVKPEVKPGKKGIRLL